MADISESHHNWCVPKGRDEHQAHLVGMSVECLFMAALFNHSKKAGAHVKVSSWHKHTSNVEGKSTETVMKQGEPESQAYMEGVSYETASKIKRRFLRSPVLDSAVPGLDQM